ncbi:hypothetical protein C942_02650 [Photobacterium marinum]|uniref:Uncharacterized protein n=1 Tax=Photobacterium marinum TaxID=1056511 RepID=L8JI75_9GAMM|nr:hypothetical protein C942_02650 [Photobacterium marinum]
MEPALTRSHLFLINRRHGIKACHSGQKYVFTNNNAQTRLRIDKSG